MLGRFCLPAVFLMILSVASQSLAEVKIAILDSGCNIEYEEGISFVDNSTKDLNGHGTLVANAIREINPGAKLYVAKIFTANGRNLDAKPLAKGIRWAIERKVDVINLSCQIRKDDRNIHNAIREAYSKGIIVVASAGNKGDFLDKLMNELSKRKRSVQISTGVNYPAKYEEVIAIGAVNGLRYIDRLENYSPVGKEIEFVCAGSYQSQKGTSFAAARATGIISRIKMDYPQLSGIQLREFLRVYATDLGDKGRDVKFGYGKLKYAHEVARGSTQTNILTQ